MHITATQVNYFFVCKRKLWLFTNGINMEYNSDLVGEGRLIHSTSYPERSERFEEVSIGGSKIDFFDPKQNVIHEIKKSDSLEEAHIWQVKYYIWLFEREGIKNVTGILEYPSIRHRELITLSTNDSKKIECIIDDIGKIVSNEKCPPKISKKYCHKCSYFDFCYVADDV